MCEEAECMDKWMSVWTNEYMNDQSLRLGKAKK